MTGLWEAGAMAVRGMRCPSRSASLAVSLRDGAWFPLICRAWVTVEEQAVAKRGYGFCFGWVFLLVLFPVMPSHFWAQSRGWRSRGLLGGPVLSRSCWMCLPDHRRHSSCPGRSQLSTHPPLQARFVSTGLSWLHPWTMVWINATCNAGDTCWPGPWGPNGPAVAGGWWAFTTQGGFEWLTQRQKAQYTVTNPLIQADPHLFPPFLFFP